MAAPMPHNRVWLVHTHASTIVRTQLWSRLQRRSTPQTLEHFHMPAIGLCTRETVSIRSIVHKARPRRIAGEQFHDNLVCKAGPLHICLWLIVRRFQMHVKDQPDHIDKAMDDHLGCHQLAANHDLCGHMPRRRHTLHPVACSWL